MEIIVMKSGACRELMDKIDAIERYIRTERPQQPQIPATEDLWLDNAAVCAYLKVSRRTLQRYRSTGTLAYSMIGHKTYYKISEIRRLLEDRRVRRGGGSEIPSKE